VEELSNDVSQVKNATLTTGDYGWLVVNGFVAVEANTTDSLAVGDRIVMGTDGVHSASTTATALVANQRIHGYMLDGTATAGSALDHVKCFL